MITLPVTPSPEDLADLDAAITYAANAMGNPNVSEKVKEIESERQAIPTIVPAVINSCPQ